LSLLRGRGIDGYVDGSISRPQAPTFANHPSLPNSTMPSTEEFDLRNGLASAVLYQSMEDPIAHGIMASDSARTIWVKVH